MGSCYAIACWKRCCRIAWNPSPMRSWHTMASSYQTLHRARQTQQRSTSIWPAPAARLWQWLPPPRPRPRTPRQSPADAPVPRCLGLKGLQERLPGPLRPRGPRDLPQTPCRQAQKPHPASRRPPLPPPPLAPLPAGQRCWRQPFPAPPPAWRSCAPSPPPCGSWLRPSSWPSSWHSCRLLQQRLPPPAPTPALGPSPPRPRALQGWGRRQQTLPRWRCPLPDGQRRHLATTETRRTPPA
mmetsp:Transcript_8284/g.25758  ORF Transcript_8284/g.25758 Transcript_8284/m.25758 type:complete len:240 (+) Transcript_8284:467-1186(+)